MIKTTNQSWLQSYMQNVVKATESKKKRFEDKLKIQHCAS